MNFCRTVGYAHEGDGDKDGCDESFHNEWTDVAKLFVGGGCLLDLGC